jgi:hypothetical protein|tara:strand:- start:4369 stop:5076 length:708 start_codon:yes stop_codon:yes gene_type:complete
MDDGSCLTVIIILYLFLFLLNFYIKIIIAVKQNWSEYRCHPLAIPVASLFGEDPGKNFDDCVGAMQQGMMDSYLDPIYSNFDEMNTLNAETTQSAQGLTIAQGNLKNTMNSPDFNQDIDGLDTSQIDAIKAQGGGGSGSGSGGAGGALPEVTNIVNNIALLTTKWGTTLGDTTKKMTATITAFAQFVAAMPIIGESVVNSEAVKVVQRLSDIAGFTTMSGVSRRRGFTKKSLFRR